MSVIVCLCGGGLYLLDDSFLDPKYHYDFRKVGDLEDLSEMASAIRDLAGGFALRSK